MNLMKCFSSNAFVLFRARQLGARRSHPISVDALLRPRTPSLADVTVSDHVVIRWLERVMDFDLDAVRAAIITEAGPAAALGAKSVRKGGRTFIIESGCIVTVLHGDKRRLPNRHR